MEQFIYRTVHTQTSILRTMSCGGAMKHGDLIVALGICMGMSACASQYVKHELGAKQGHVAADYQYRVILADQLVAIGTPKTQIANHADAWVLIGKQYSYLMTVSGKPTGYL